MTPQEQFRFGFLARCAEEGCSPQEIELRVKAATAPKTPWEFVWSMLSGIGGPAGRFAATAPVHAALAGAGIAGLGGAGTGYLLAKSRDTQIDPEEVKARELADTYRQYTRRLMQLEQQRRAPGVPRTPQLLDGGF